MPSFLPPALVYDGDSIKSGWRWRWGREARRGLRALACTVFPEINGERKCRRQEKTISGCHKREWGGDCRHGERGECIRAMKCVYLMLKDHNGEIQHGE